MSVRNAVEDIERDATGDGLVIKQGRMSERKKFMLLALPSVRLSLLPRSAPLPRGRFHFGLDRVCTRPQL